MQLHAVVQLLGFYKPKVKLLLDRERGMTYAAGGALSPNGVMSPKGRDLREGLQAVEAALHGDNYEPFAAAESARADAGEAPEDGSAPPMTTAEAQVESCGPHCNLFPKLLPDVLSNIFACDCNFVPSSFFFLLYFIAEIVPDGTCAELRQSSSVVYPKFVGSAQVHNSTSVVCWFCRNCTRCLHGSPQTCKASSTQTCG